jgi:hypothetical protein
VSSFVRREGAGLAKFPVKSRQQYEWAIMQIEGPLPGRVSQFDGVVEHPLRELRSQTCFGDDVHLVSEQLLEIHQEPSQIEESAILVEVDEEVDVARFGGVTATDPTTRTREAPRARAVARISLRRFRRSVSIGAPTGTG